MFLPCPSSFWLAPEKSRFFLSPLNTAISSRHADTCWSHRAESSGSAGGLSHQCCLPQSIGQYQWWNMVKHHVKPRFVSTWKPNIHCSGSKESDMIRQVRRLRFSMLLGVKAKDCRHQRHQRYVIFVESLRCLPGKVEWQDKPSMALHDCERLWVQNCPRLQMVSLPFSLFSCSWVALCCAACDVLKG